MSEAFEHRGHRNACRTAGKIWVRFAVFAGLCVSLSACGVSQVTEPLQRSLFGDDEAEQNAAEQPQPTTPVTPAAGDNGATSGFSTNLTRAPLGCPTLNISPELRTITFSAPGGGTDPQSVMHQGEIVKVARECGTSADGVAIKYGFSGRVLLGPRGKPGSITLPAKLKVLDRQNAVVKEQVIRVVVNVASGQTSGTFSEVKEVNLPVPVGQRATSYKLLIGFENAPGTG